MKRPPAEDSLAGLPKQSDVEKHRLTRDHNRVLQAFLNLKSDPDAVAFHMENTHIRVLDNRTLNEVICAGEADKALRYLRSISGGQNG